MLQDAYEAVSLRNTDQGPQRTPLTQEPPTRAGTGTVRADIP